MQAALPMPDWGQAIAHVRARGKAAWGTSSLMAHLGAEVLPDRVVLTVPAAYARWWREPRERGEHPRRGVVEDAVLEMMDRRVEWVFGGGL